MPIPQDTSGKPTIHYTNVYRAFAKWADDGSLQQAFIASVAHLFGREEARPPCAGTATGPTRWRKRGDRIGYSGDKHQKGRRSSRLTDNHGYVLSPLPVAPVNETDMVLLPDGLNALKQVAKMTGLV